MLVTLYPQESVELNYVETRSADGSTCLGYAPRRFVRHQGPCVGVLSEFADSVRCPDLVAAALPGLVRVSPPDGSQVEVRARVVTASWRAVGYVSCTDAQDAYLDVGGWLAEALGVDHIRARRIQRQGMTYYLLDP